jgi:hypothetical protein
MKNKQKNLKIKKMYQKTTEKQPKTAKKQEKTRKNNKKQHENNIKTTKRARVLYCNGTVRTSTSMTRLYCCWSTW